MILKVSDGNQGWHLLDGVERAHLVAYHGSVTRSTIPVVSEDGVELLNLIAKACFDKSRAIEVGVLEYHRKGVRERALFTQVVYVCNNSGDTIDKIAVRKVSNGRS